MKEKNGYTWLLCLLALASCVYILQDINHVHIVQALPIFMLIILLDLFPVRLPSGDEYSGGVTGFLILLLAYGLETAYFGIVFSTFFYYLKTSGWKLRRIPYFRMSCTIGMYTVCISVTSSVINHLSGASMYITSAVGALTFEIVNILLLAGIFTSVAGAKYFENIHFKLKELIVPLILCTTVVPHFIHHLETRQLVFETIYTAMFLTLIIFFSRAYLHQAQLRKRASEEFIRLCEVRQAKPSHGHGSRLGVFAEYVIDKTGYKGSGKNELVMSAILHDIGKVQIPPHILTKRGALSLSEEKEYQSHSEKGAETILHITGNKKVADWIRYHHERFDGKGYPSGLKGKEIPIESRIIALCNQLDYVLAEPVSDEAAYQKLLQQSGRVLDPVLVSQLEIEDIRYLRSRITYTVETEEAEEQEELVAESERGGFIGSTSLIRYKPDEALSGLTVPALADEIKLLAARAFETRQYFFELMKDNGRTFEVHFHPEPHEVSIIMSDITPAIQYRDTIHNNIMRSYKDVIETLSNSKVDICLSREEIQEQLGTYIASMEVKEKGDVAISRTFVAEHYPDQQDAKRLMHIKLAVSEGVTNLIKHAVGGRVSLYCKEDRMQILITDQGSGIPLHELPKTVLVSGYSSKRSLGKGFALMHASTDHVSLHTYSKGTSLLLEFNALMNGQGNASSYQPAG
ncbi:HD domain-containing phosphohydrolase [Paenibacillus tarimensis]|uniref:HD domain-containing phosphohydrolase n=1 Tax=Paenibacillus tarimensis TaxID=416012 RepID=UPI001F45A9F3|nr:HD domain-containing phosphohydrolase [Paenibacillus tarimensis]MCF2942757.1 HD domain-containing protein [Paenibacillus tarimensis]